MKVEDDIFFSRFSFFLLPLLSEEYLNHRNSKSIGPRWDWYVNFLFLKDSHPENLIRIPSQRLQHGHKQPTTNNCIQQLFYNYNNNIQTRNQPPDTNHQITSREFLHTHTHPHQTQAFGCAWFVPSQRLERSDNFGGWDRVLVGNSRWRNRTKSWCSAPQEIMKTRRTWWMTRKLYVYIIYCMVCLFSFEISIHSVT